MEEYTPLLWMLIIGVISLSSASKVRKMAAKAAKHLEQRLPNEAWPTWDTSEERTDADRADHREGEPTPSPFEPVVRQTEEFRQRDRHQPLQAAPASGMDAQRLTSSPQAEDTPENGETSGIAEEFDLRKAVIYSELLKPKFEE